MEFGKLDSENYTITFKNENIVHLRIKDFKELTKEDLIELQAWAKTQSDNPYLVNLIEFGHGSNSSREAREYVASDKANHIAIGSAVLVKTLAQQLVIEFFMKFNKPLFPTTVHYKMENALKWIDEFIKKNVPVEK